MLTPQRSFLAIIIVTAISLFIALPSELPVSIHTGPLNFNRTFYKRPLSLNIFGGHLIFDPQIKLGLDLRGGTHLILDTDMSQIPEADRLDALESSKEVISRRIDLFGVSEPLIQTSVNQDANQYQIIVELPGVNDVDQAISLIGQTAQLEFKELPQDIDPTSTDSAQISLDTFASSGLTGKDLTRSTVEFDPQTGNPVVGLKFTQEGSQLFSDITARNLNRPVAIFLDDLLVTAPYVQAVIDSGEAVISGQFTTDQAKNLSIQLNAGALPVPIQVMGQNTVGATLGNLSVAQSLEAGLIGLFMVMLFMALYYGRLGLLADTALIIYSLITLAIYKTFAVTLTLPGLAGFILSVGMAVDSNILIFERTKEELRAGKQWRTAVELGFGRAWDSIKDANLATLIITFILFNPFNWTFLVTSGLVRGFALTLAIGIFISLFTGIVVTRTLIRLFYYPKQS